MQAAPEIVMPSWFLLVAIGLAIFGLFMCGTVLLTFRGVHRPGAGLRSFATTCLWMAPAVLIIVIFWSRGLHRLREESQPATATVLVTSPAEEGPHQSVNSDIQLASLATVSRGSSVAGQETLKATVVSSDAPAWVSEPVWAEDGKVRIVLSSQQFATLEEAQDQLTLLVREAIRRHFHAEFPDCGTWDIPASMMSRHLTHNVVGEQIDKDFGKGISGKMYRVHAQLELSPLLRQAMHATWREQIVEQRLIVLGSLLGLVTLMLATAAGYFKLDALSFGMYRGRLKLAAISLIAAGSLVVSRLV